jgi:hypothetical protein
MARPYDTFTTTTDSLTYRAHLIIDERGGMRITRSPAAMSTSERSIQLVLTIPKAVFRRPQLIAQITIDDADARSEIVAKVAAQAKDVLREAMGLDLTIVEEPKP